MILTEEQLQEWQRLADAATKGPWSFDMDYVTGGDGHLLGELIVTSGPDQREANGAFIVAARTAVPELIAEVRRLRREVLRWRPIE